MFNDRKKEQWTTEATWRHGDSLNMHNMAMAGGYDIHARDYADYHGCICHDIRKPDYRRAWYEEAPRTADNIPFAHTTALEARRAGFTLLKMNVVTKDNIYRALNDLREYLRQRAANEFVFGDEERARRYRDDMKRVPCSHNEVESMIQAGEIFKVRSNVVAVYIGGGAITTY